MIPVRNVMIRETNRAGGFTLIEFMVAVGLLGILMVAVMSSFTFQQQTYVVTDQVAEAKQNVRVIADLIERDIRNAGYMVPRTAALCGVDSTNGPDKLYVSDYTQIVSMSALPANQLTTPMGAQLQNISVASGVQSSTPTLEVDRVDIDGIGGGSNFAMDAGVIVGDLNASTTSVACGTVTAVGNIALPIVPISVDMENDTGPLTAGTQLVAVPAIVYEIVGTTLERNGIPLVENVEDFQVAWFFDLNGDSNVDPGEMIADGVGAADDYDPENLDATLLREVRISIIVRTRDNDPNRSWRQGIGQALENRDPGTVAAQDGMRRRAHTATIRLRNSLS